MARIRQVGWKITLVAITSLAVAPSRAVDAGTGSSPHKVTKQVRLTRGKTTVIGPLEKRGVDKVADQHQAELLRCASRLRWASANQDVAGAVVVLFHVDGSGIVTDAELSESDLGTSNDPVAQCFVDRVKRWKFARPLQEGPTAIAMVWLISKG